MRRPMPPINYPHLRPVRFASEAQKPQSDKVDKAEKQPAKKPSEAKPLTLVDYFAFAIVGLAALTVVGLRGGYQIYDTYYRAAFGKGFEERQFMIPATRVLDPHIDQVVQGLPVKGSGSLSTNAPWGRQASIDLNFNWSIPNPEDTLKALQKASPEMFTPQGVLKTDVYCRYLNDIVEQRLLGVLDNVTTMNTFARDYTRSKEIARRLELMLQEGYDPQASEPWQRFASPHNHQLFSLNPALALLGAQLDSLKIEVKRADTNK